MVSGVIKVDGLKVSLLKLQLNFNMNNKIKSLVHWNLAIKY